MLDAWALNEGRAHKRVARTLYVDGLLRGASCIHVLSEAERGGLEALGIATPSALVPNGTDLPAAFGGQTGDPAPKEWRGRKILLFLGRLHPKKGLLPLVEGWARAACGSDGWRLAIAGPGAERHLCELQKRIDEEGVADSVRLVGAHYGDDKSDWLQRADAFVLPSLSEGFAMAPLEAMAYRLPVILTPGCQFPQAFEKKAAIPAEPDPGSLAGALCKLFAMSDAERADMGSRGRELVANAYTWPRIASSMVQVYSWVLGNAPAPACLVMPRIE
jgi:poly(glycerol-phosphate) alpha-glucosyltransferase